MGDPSFLDRAVLSIARTRGLDTIAMKALIKASELLGLALGIRLAELRDSEDPLQAAFADGQASFLLANCFQEVSELLAFRWDKLPDRQRPQYTPEQRFRILRLKKLSLWTQDETARRFRVSVQTVARWERESARSELSVARPRIRPNPPVRRYADVVRQLVHLMRFLGFGGYERIAQTIARAGFRISARTVARILREKPPPTRPPAQSPPTNRTVRASFPNHVFLIDLTDIRSFFGLFTFKLAVLLDVFSRFPVAARLFQKEPTSAELASLLRQTTSRHPVPRHLVSDQGSQFTSKHFRDTARSFGVRHRFGAIGRVGSIAILERFWKTLKIIVSLRAFPPLFRQDLERRLELALRYYAFFKPHQGLRRHTRRNLLRPRPRLPTRRPSAQGETRRTPD